MELLSFPAISPDSVAAIQGFLDNCHIIDINSSLKKLTVEVRKEWRLKLPDAVIAATALYSQLTLFTADKQFDKITNIPIVLYEL